MKRVFFYLVLTFNFINFQYAQNKLLSLDELMVNRKLYPENLQQLQWIPSSDNYTYVANNALVQGNATNNLRDTLLKIADINTCLKGMITENIKRFPTITWLKKDVFMFSYKNQLFTYTITSKKMESVNKFDERADNQDIEPNTLAIAYTKENNLFVAVKGNELAITNDDEKNILNGQAAHRNEWGINKGTFWSPKGNYLAYYRMDQTMVTDYPLVNIESRIAEVDPIKYPMAGMKSHQVTLGIYNVATKKTIFLKTGEPKEQFLTNITWSLDEKMIYIAVLNRDQNWMKLNQYNAETGDFIKTLFEEKSDKYVEPERGPMFFKTKPNQFLWFSDRDGWDQLYLYDTDGKLIDQVTKGLWQVIRISGLDKDEKKLFYISTEENAVEMNIYSINLSTKKTEKLSITKASHDALVSNDGKYIIDSYSSITIPKQYDVINTSTKKTIQTIFSATNPLKDYKLGETYIFTIKADDNTDLYCRMIKPADFNPAKKYPVFIYVYGGPHSQLVYNTWLGGSDLFLQFMAENGYLVFTMDNRGTSYRGNAFEQCIFRNLGVLEVKDQMKGVEYLKKLNYVDSTRIGADGWSYGGFMTISMMLKNPGVFKVACAGGPVIDWKFYEIMYGERYMDRPQENPEGYRNANLINYVKDLQGKLLVIHGAQDNTVVWQNSLQFISKCIEEGKQVDYFIYPLHEHNVRGADRAHLFKKIYQYFEDYLKP